MRRPIAATLLLLSLISSAPQAEVATPEEMTQVCRNWLTYVLHEQDAWAGSDAPWIANMQSLTSGDTLLAQCFAIEPRGFVIVPVLKELAPIKAYSETSDFDPGQAEGFVQLLREVLASRIRDYVDAYGSLAARQPAVGAVLLGREHREEWEQFLVPPAQFAIDLTGGMLATMTQAGPLLTTAWHQRDPYYDDCPWGNGGRCLVGCVATAAAQVMNFHEWPPSGVGSYTYRWPGDYSCSGSYTTGYDLTATLSDAYDWNNMPDNCTGGCTQAERDAVAELCFEVGVTLDMSYGKCCSSTWTFYSLWALPKNFHYSVFIDKEDREDHTAATWFDIVKEEIDADRPMLYRIYRHAIVCDGWKDTGGTNMYHVNYGWADNHTAWYTIDNIYGSSNPEDEEYLIRRIEPARSYVVKPDGTGDFATIQDAIDAVYDGATIELASGIFRGPGNRDLDTKGKAITIRSQAMEADSVRIDPQGTTSDWHRGFHFHSGEGPATILQRISIWYGYHFQGGGVHCDSSSSPTLTDVVIRSCGGDSGAGICCDRNSSPELIDCIINDNYNGDWGAGLTCFEGSSPNLVGCSFAHNHTYMYGGGMACFGGSHPTLTHCTFVDNTVYGQMGTALYADTGSTTTIDNSIFAFSTGTAFMCYSDAIPTFTCCDIYGNTGGDWVGNIAGQLNLRNNFCADPKFCDRNMWDYTIHWSSPCHIMNNTACGWVGAWGLGCGMLLPNPDHLIDGTYIAHHNPLIQFTHDQPPEGWGNHLINSYPLDGCAGQNPTLDGSSAEGSVWYVLSAWPEEKRWCGAQFGLGGFPHELFSFVDWGPCFPNEGIEMPEGGWPGPNTGTTLVTDMGQEWFGNFLPIYYFTGYAHEYMGGLIPFGEHPSAGPALWANCESPAEFFEPVCLGGMGVNAPGIYCCPPDLGDELYACCLADGACQLVIEETCTGLGGEFHAEWGTCDPNPCPQPEGACCVAEHCVVTYLPECAVMGGVWHVEWESCDPNPCRLPHDWLDHNVGDCILTVTDQGIIGFMDATQAEGSGFLYPLPDSTNLMFIGSLWVGDDPTYVANRDYEADPQQEWIVTSDPDGHVWTEEWGLSDQDIHAAYSDQYAAAPRNLLVEQDSWGYIAGRPGGPLVMMRYTITNRGTEPLMDLYVGCFIDFDFGSYAHNWGGTELDRKLVYITGETDLYAGVALLQDYEPAPPIANLTLIDNATFVWPEGYVLDADKYAFLSAADSAHVMLSPPDSSDFSLLASAGPFNLAAGEETLVAFAIMGGRSVADLRERAGIAEMIFRDGSQDVPPSSIPLRTLLFQNQPNPFSAETLIRFDLAHAGDVSLRIFDLNGRALRTLARGQHPAMRYALYWDGRDDVGQSVPAGIYFLRLDAPETSAVQRLMRIP